MLSNEAAAFLRAHMGNDGDADAVRPPPHWRHLRAGESMPLDPSQRVSLRDVALLVADHRRKAALKHPRTFTLADARVATTKSVRVQSVLPGPKEQYSWQREAHEAIFYEPADSPAPEVFAHSGLLIVPCGTGKSRVAAHAALEMRGPSLFVVPTNEAIMQYATLFASSEFARFGLTVRVCGDAAKKRKRRDEGEAHPSITSSAIPFDASPPSVTLVTYAYLSRKMENDVAALPSDALSVLWLWRFRLLVLDEVWKASAKTYLQTCAAIQTEVRLGLTADERRSDNQQRRFQQLVGPVLFCMSTERAQTLGVISTVHATVTLVPTSPRFRTLYEAAVDTEERHLLTALMPRKVTELLRFLATSAARKIFVFCDKLGAHPSLAALLEKAASLGGRPYLGCLSSRVCARERAETCQLLRSSRVGVALLSRCANAALDVPDVQTVIELCVCDASAQQNTQRRGRAQRQCAAKVMIAEATGSGSEVVTFVASDTHEERLQRRRHETSRDDGDVVWRELEMDDKIEPSHGSADPRALLRCPWGDDDLAALVRTARRQQKTTPHVTIGSNAER